MKTTLLAAALSVTLMATAAAVAADPNPKPQADADLAAKSAQIETLRARAAAHPSATASSTLIEAESLLRQLRQAPPDKRTALRSQLEAALVRLDLEIDAAARGR